MISTPDAAPFLIAAAGYYYSDKDFHTAEKWFERALRLDPLNERTGMNLAVCMLHTSRLTTATRDDAQNIVDMVRLNRALHLFWQAAKGPTPIREQALDQHLQAALLALWLGVLDDGMLGEVAESAHFALLRSPRNVRAAAVIGYNLYRRGNLLRASRLAQRFLRQFSAEEIEADFELRPWSQVRCSDAFFNTVDRQPLRIVDGSSVEFVKLPQGQAPTVLVGCDEGYWRRFGADFLASLFTKTDQMSAHIHLVNPSRETVLDLCERLDGQDYRVSVSIENVDLTSFSPHRQLTYYASARFPIAYELLTRFGLTVVQCDVDALFLGNVMTAIPTKAWDVVIARDFRRRGPMRDFLAGLMVFNTTDPAIRFLELTTKYISWHFRNGAGYWTLDQSAPYCVFGYMQSSGIAPQAFWFDLHASEIIDFSVKNG